MSFFDDSHVTEVGLQGSAGPSVGFGEMIRQSFQQQFRVDSARALDDELRNRWLESLRAAKINDQINVVPDPLGRNPRIDPDDPWAYRAFAQHVSGQPIDAFDPNKTLGGYDPNARISAMVAANEKIKALNNPNIKSFEQILEEVSQMQHEVEGETASMYERTGKGGFVASLLGSIGGSFTTRDPLNLITAPIGAGRTIAMRVATDMGLAAAVVGYTELAEVAPAREIVGLPQRNPLYNIGAATIGAGVIRGGLEGIGAGVRHLRGADEVIDFDLRDSQLQQMFEANADKPSARAGASILNDVNFIERNNPYGEGQQANLRFIAELQSVQRAMNGEPMTAVARVLPPVPNEQLKKVADFEIVREQAPEVYGRMEAAQAKVQQLSRSGEPENVSPVFRNFDRLKEKVSSEQRGAKEIWMSPDEYTTLALTRKNAVIPQEGPVGELQTRIEEEGLKSTPYLGLDNAGKVTEQEGLHRAAALKNLGYEQIPVRIYGDVAKLRRAANVEYQAAYRAVEAEAARIHEQQACLEATQQHEVASILASEGLPFTGPLLRHDNISSLADRINAFNDTLDERTAARFVRESFGEGENKVEVETWEKDGGIDIGLKDPVDPNFTFLTDDGEMTIAQAMRDLQDDADLVEAIKGCAI